MLSHWCLPCTVCLWVRPLLPLLLLWQPLDPSQTYAPELGLHPAFCNPHGRSLGPFSDPHPQPEPGALVLLALVKYKLL